jgi:ketosteroid isomerase-like protein
MSQENVEAVKAWVVAINRGDLAALVALADPAVEFRSYLASVAGEQGAYRGHEGLRKYLRDLEDAWERFRIDAREYRDLGDVVFNSGKLEASGRASGLQVEQEFGCIHRFGGGTGPGRFLGMEFFTSRTEALEAVGLQE